MATNATSIVNIIGNFEKDNDIALLKQELNNLIDSKVEFQNGTGSGKINEIYMERHTLTSASGTLELDLTTILNPAGVRINFSNVKIIYIKNREPNGGSVLKVGGASTLTWTAFLDSITAKNIVDPGGELFLQSQFDGYPVTAGSRNLGFENDGASSGDLDFDVFLAGE